MTHDGERVTGEFIAEAQQFSNEAVLYASHGFAAGNHAAAAKPVELANVRPVQSPASTSWNASFTSSSSPFSRASGAAVSRALDRTSQDVLNRLIGEMARDACGLFSADSREVQTTGPAGEQRLVAGALGVADQVECRQSGALIVGGNVIPRRGRRGSI